MSITPEPQESQPPESESGCGCFLVLLLAVVVAVAIGFYQRRVAEREFAAGQKAFQAGDCRRAIEHYDRVINRTVYRLVFSPTRALATKSRPECDLVLSADVAKSKKESLKAISLYRSYEKKYPSGRLLSHVRSGVAEAYSQWALLLARQGRYVEAIKQYQAILGSYGNTVTVTVARTGIASTYRMAIRSLRRKEHCAVIPILDDFATASSMTVAEAKRVVRAAKAALPGTLYRCGVSEYRRRSYNQATASFTRLVHDYPNSALAPKARALIQKARPAVERERIADRIADIRKEGTGKLPPPLAVGGGAPAGRVVVTIINDSPRELELLLLGPMARAVTVPDCKDCHFYNLIGGLFEPPCSSTGSRPRITLTLASGAYHAVVLAKYDPIIKPFYARWRLKSGTRYSNCLYIAKGP